jgi:hypothetical protein
MFIPSDRNIEVKNIMQAAIMAFLNEYLVDFLECDKDSVTLCGRGDESAAFTVAIEQGDVVVKVRGLLMSEGVNKLMLGVDMNTVRKHYKSYFDAERGTVEGEDQALKFCPDAFSKVKQELHDALTRQLGTDLSKVVSVSPVVCGQYPCMLYRFNVTATSSSVYAKIAEVLAELGVPQRHA